MWAVTHFRVRLTRSWRRGSCSGDICASWQRLRTIAIKGDLSCHRSGGQGQHCFLNFLSDMSLLLNLGGSSRKQRGSVGVRRQYWWTNHVSAGRGWLMQLLKQLLLWLRRLYSVCCWRCRAVYRLCRRMHNDYLAMIVLSMQGRRGVCWRHRGCCSRSGHKRLGNRSEWSCWGFWISLSEGE